MHKQLSQGLSDLGLELSDAQQEQLLQYLKLLSRWNKAYNLTAIRDESAMVTKHLLDSLSVLPYLDGQRFIDVGTGAGLPGIPLAIALPDRHFSLLDSNGKKTRFLVHAINELGLSNVDVVKSRVADFLPGQAYDAVLSRAFASLDDMIMGCQHLVAPAGEFLAMKGQRPDEELERVDSNQLQISVIDLQVPNLAEYRCLLRIRVNADLEKP